MSAQPQLEGITIVSLLEPGGTFPLQIIETFNAIINDGSNVVAGKLDLIAPPKLTLEITQLSTLEDTTFLLSLRSGKCNQICVVVTEDKTSAIFGRQ